MTQLFESKSVLAKLLAEENLNIVHRKVKTAYFDLNSRSIILPFWKEMDGVIYDLLMGHEVGHALNTPKQGWHDAISENSALKSYLNVCEDARIERKMKDKFPGLRRSFALAYKKLHEEDFFGLNGLDVSKLRLIDRINIFFKLGAHVRVPFTQEELKYVDRLQVANTWDDVEVIARELYAKALEDKKNNPDQDNDEPENMDGFPVSNDSDDSDYDDESENSEDSEKGENGDDGDVDSNESDENSDSDSDSEESNDTYGSDASEEEPEDQDDVSSITDRAQRINENKLVENTEGEILIANIPEYNDKYFISHTKVHYKISQAIAIAKSKIEYKDFMDLYDARYTDLIKRSTPMINYMIKEFEMRKNASQLARAKTAKSGKINPKKLARYNLDQDLFQRVMNVPYGQNHGLVMFIDLSGSMKAIIEKTFEQAIVLTMFCKKINIPFEVYGFSNHHSVQQYKTTSDSHKYCELKENDLSTADEGFHIKQYLSSSMTTNVYRESIKNMLHVGAAHRNYWLQHLLPYTETLYGTPLDEAIIASIDLVSSFKKNHKLDRVNSIFLTDGCGAPSYGVTRYNYAGKLQEHFFNPKDTVFVQHKETKIRARIENKTKNSNRSDYYASSRALLEIAQKVTGAKYTGYFIASKHDIYNSVMPYEFQYINKVVEKEQRRSISEKVNDQGFYASDKFGFSEYFFVLNSNLKIEEQKIEVEAEAKKGQIARAFAKSLNNRGLQRMFLNRFVQNIAA